MYNQQSNQSEGISLRGAPSIAGMVSGNKIAGDVLLIDAATKDASIASTRIWDAVSTLCSVADSLFGGSEQGVGTIGTAPMPTPSGRLYGLAEAQGATSRAIDALNTQVARFRGL